MKTLKFLAVLLFAALMLTIAVAKPPDLSAQVLYDPATRQTFPVVLSPIGKFDKVLGTRASLSLSAFAGVNSASKPVGGFALTYSSSLASNLSLTVGPALLAEPGRVRTVGVFAGFSARF